MSSLISRNNFFNAIIKVFVALARSNCLPSSVLSGLSINFKLQRRTGWLMFKIEEPDTLLERHLIISLKSSTIFDRVIATVHLNGLKLV